jgi:carbonic anhydrase
MLLRMQRNRNFQSLLVEMQSGATSLEDSLAISYGLNVFLPHYHYYYYYHNNCTPEFLKEVEK